MELYLILHLYISGIILGFGMLIMFNPKSKYWMNLAVLLFWPIIVPIGYVMGLYKGFVLSRQNS